MTAAPLIVILIAAGEGQSPSTQALLASARQALGDQATVGAREASDSPADLTATARQLAAAAVAQSTWLNQTHTRARIRVRVMGSEGELRRDVAFSPSDDETERGRTLGFTIASMLPDAGFPTSGPTPATPDHRATALSPTSGGQPATARTDSGRPRPDAALVSPEGTPPGPGTTTPPRRPWSLTLGILGAVGADGPGGGVGGGARLALETAPDLSIHAGLVARKGQLDAVAGDQVMAALQVGALWRPTVTTGAGASRVGLGLRADGMAILQAASRNDGDGTKWDQRVVPGADLLVQVDFAPRPGLWLVASAGAEVTLGRTDVLIGERRATTIAALRFVSELAVRFGL